MEIALNLYTNLGCIDIFTMLSHPILDHSMSLSIYLDFL